MSINAKWAPERDDVLNNDHYKPNSMYSFLSNFSLYGALMSSDSALVFKIPCS